MEIGSTDYYISNRFLVVEVKVVWSITIHSNRLFVVEAKWFNSNHMLMVEAF